MNDKIGNVADGCIINCVGNCGLPSINGNGQSLMNIIMYGKGIGNYEYFLHTKLSINIQGQEMKEKIDEGL